MAVFNLKVCSWNANSVRYKLNNLNEFLNRAEVDLMLISETKLSNKDKITIKNYNCVSYSRRNAAGGVLILIKHNIPYKVVKIKGNTTIENVCIKLANNVHIIAAYNRPMNVIETEDLDTLYPRPNFQVPRIRIPRCNDSYNMTKNKITI